MHQVDEQQDPAHGKPVLHSDDLPEAVDLFDERVLVQPGQEVAQSEHAVELRVRPQKHHDDHWRERGECDEQQRCINSAYWRGSA